MSALKKCAAKFNLLSSFVISMSSQVGAASIAIVSVAAIVSNGGDDENLYSSALNSSVCCWPSDSRRS